MFLNLKKSVAIFLVSVMLVALTACKEETKPKNESSKPANNNFTIAAEDDTKDPENTENNKVDGEKVDISEIQAKKGLQNGIDVSKWQGKIDWQKVKKSGIDFAIIRVGYRAENGQLYRDSNADYNIQQAERSGVLVGVYFFSTAVNEQEAIEEAQWTVSLIKGYKISYPVVYDCEGFKNADSRMYSLTAEQRTQNAIAFLNTVTKSGYEGMFYGSKADLTDNAAFNTAKIEKNFKIWIAQ